MELEVNPCKPLSESSQCSLGHGSGPRLLSCPCREYRRLREAVQGPRPVREPQHRQDLFLHLPLLVRLEPPVQEARGGGLRRGWPLRVARAPAVPQQRPPGCGGGGQGRGPAEAAQQPPPPAQPLRRPPQHPRRAGRAPRAPRGVERRSEAAVALGVNSSPRHLSAGSLPLPGLSPYLSWFSGAPPIARTGREAEGARSPPQNYWRGKGKPRTPAEVSGGARSRPGASESGPR